MYFFLLFYDLWRYNCVILHKRHFWVIPPGLAGAVKNDPTVSNNVTGAKKRPETAWCSELTHNNRLEQAFTIMLNSWLTQPQEMMHIQKPNINWTTGTLVGFISHDFSIVGSMITQTSKESSIFAQPPAVSPQGGNYRKFAACRHHATNP